MLIPTVHYSMKDYGNLMIPYSVFRGRWAMGDPSTSVKSFLILHTSLILRPGRNFRIIINQSESLYTNRAIYPWNPRNVDIYKTPRFIVEIYVNEIDRSEIFRAKRMNCVIFWAVQICTTSYDEPLFILPPKSANFAMHQYPTCPN